MLTLSHKEVIELSFFKTYYFLSAFSEMQKSIELNSSITTKPVVTQLKQLVDSDGIYKVTADLVAEEISAKCGKKIIISIW